MNCFIVMSPEAAMLRDAVHAHFPDHSHLLMPGVWAVAAVGKSSVDVTKMLNIDSVDSGFPGVVVELENYYGYFDNALWNKLNLWQRTE